VRRAVLTASLFLCALGCGPDYYPPPAQRTPRQHAVEAMLDMSAGRPAEEWGKIVAGLQPPGDPNADWRWAGDHATFSFDLSGDDRRSLTAHLTVAQTVLDKTGPQKLTFEVNGTTVGSATLGVSRRYDFSFPVDPALFHRSQPIVVRLLASPCVPAPNGPPYCVLLHSIGFVQEPR
jgi:hypothetical protein